MNYGKLKLEREFTPSIDIQHLLEMSPSTRMGICWYQAIIMVRSPYGMFGPAKGLVSLKVMQTASNHPIFGISNRHSVSEMPM